MVSASLEEIIEGAKGDAGVSDAAFAWLQSLLLGCVAQARALECRLSPGARLRELPDGVVDLAAERHRRRGRPAAPVGVAS